MAEKIRYVLLTEYKANIVDVSQKIDENSFGNSMNENSGFSSNYILYIICAIVLCGGIIVGVQKKFPFKYAAVYSKLLPGNSNNNDNNIDHENSNFKSISIDKYTKNGNDGNQTNKNDKNERDLKLSTNSPKSSPNSAEVFLQKVLKNIGTPSFITSKYIQNLKDDYISSIEQLREFDDEDWKRYGFKKSHITIIKNKLHNNDDDEDDDVDEDEDDDDSQDDDDDDDSELSISDDAWGASTKSKKTKGGNKSKKKNNNNSNSTDSGFDDF